MNPLMLAMQGAQNPTNKMAQIANLVQMLKAKDPAVMAQQLLQTNPQFKAFIEQNKGKSFEQIAKEHGADINQIMGLMR